MQVVRQWAVVAAPAVGLAVGGGEQLPTGAAEPGDAIPSHTTTSRVVGGRTVIDSVVRLAGIPQLLRAGGPGTPSGVGRVSVAAAGTGVGQSGPCDPTGNISI